MVQHWFISSQARGGAVVKDWGSDRWCALLRALNDGFGSERGNDCFCCFRQKIVKLIPFGLCLPSIFPPSKSRPCFPPNLSTRLHSDSNVERYTRLQYGQMVAASPNCSFPKSRPREYFHVPCGRYLHTLKPASIVHRDIKPPRGSLQSNNTPDPP